MNVEEMLQRQGNMLALLVLGGVLGDLHYNKDAGFLCASGSVVSLCINVMGENKCASTQTHTQENLKKIKIEFHMMLYCLIHYLI